MKTDEMHKQQLTLKCTRKSEPRALHAASTDEQTSFRGSVNSSDSRAGELGDSEQKNEGNEGINVCARTTRGSHSFDRPIGRI